MGWLFGWQVLALKRQLGEQYTRIATVFRQWDVDHDHSIDLTELRQVADGQMVRWSDCQMTRWSDGQMVRWSDGQMWSD